MRVVGKAIPAYAANGKGKLLHAVIETPALTRHKYAFVPKYRIFKLKETLEEGFVINDTPTFKRTASSTTGSWPVRKSNRE